MPVAAAAWRVISPSGLAGRHQVGQDGQVHRHGLPFPIAGSGPGLGLVVEGDVGRLAADRIDEFAGELVGQVARSEHVFVGLGPDFGLVGADPVGFGLGLQVGDRVAGPGQGKGQAPQALDRRQALGAALVEPGDGRAQGLAVFVEVEHGAALGGERHGGQAGLNDARLSPQALAGLANRIPEDVRVLLGQSGGGGEVGLDGDAGFGQQAAARVEQQGAHALGTAVNGEQVFRRHLFLEEEEIYHKGHEEHEEDKEEDF